MHKKKTISPTRYISKSIFLAGPVAGIMALVIPYAMMENPSVIDYIQFGVIAFVIASLITGIFTYLVGYRRFLRPANQLIQQLEKNTNGNLTYELDASSLGYLEPVGDATETLLASLQQHIQLLQETSRVIDEANHRNVKGIQNISRESENVHVVLDENMYQLKDLQEQSLRLLAYFQAFHTQQHETKQQLVSNRDEILTTKNYLLQNSQHMEKTDAHFHVLMEQVNEAKATIDSFSESMNKISNSIQLITSINHQVNLLSLNASIEAARAGEHGRGFMVVADEIKKLSSKTEETTLYIVETLNESKTKGARAQDVIARGEKQSMETAKSFAELKESVSVILASLNRQSNQTNAVMNQIEENYETVHELMSNYESIAASIDEHINRTEQTKQSIDSIHRTLKEYEENISHLQQTSEEMNVLIKDYTFEENVSSNY